MGITAIVLTKNEEACLPRLLGSLGWVDEIIVVDSESEDQTAALARKYGAKIIIRKLTSFSDQWNAGIEMAAGEWVFTCDADEEVPEDMAAVLLAAVREAGPDVGGFRILRRNYALGRWLQHGQQYGKKVAWYDFVRMGRGFHKGEMIGGAVKLFRREGARFENLVHEEVRVKGRVVQLQAYVNHYTADSIQDMFDKVNFYTTLHARQIYETHPDRPPARWHRSFLWLPLKTFLFAYIRKQGFRDGFPGLARCLSMLMYEFLKNIKLYDYYRGNQGRR